MTEPCSTDLRYQQLRPRTGHYRASCRAGRLCRTRTGRRTTRKSQRRRTAGNVSWRDRILPRSSRYALYRSRAPSLGPIVVISPPRYVWSVSPVPSEVQSPHEDVVVEVRNVHSADRPAHGVFRGSERVGQDCFLTLPFGGAPSQTWQFPLCEFGCRSPRRPSMCSGPSNTPL